jgi:hypothetical protein
MKWLLAVGWLVFAAHCSDSTAAPSTRKAGEVLSEDVQHLPGGFHIVHRTIVNPPGHWEGTGHFSFLYFHKKKLCVCSGGEFSISPSKRYVMYQDGPTGKLSIFNSLTGRVTDIRKKYLGRPKEFAWNEKQGLVVVTFHQGLDNRDKDLAPLSVRLH